MSTALADFLLARIAEDEVRLSSTETQAHWPECDYPGDMPGICDCDLLPRLLAECNVKRRIIAAVDGLYGQWYDEIETSVRGLLALPYSDHPDYREEWRP